MSKNNTFFLLPSQIFVTSENYSITTILGSCVAICLWDDVKKIGGMNHFLLPYWNGNGLASPKYGSIAVEKLLARMIVEGSNAKNIKAKVFGGGYLLGLDSSIFNIGKRNIVVAEKLLEESNIEIVAKSVGGKRGRKILFDTETGIVRQKLLQTK